MAINDSSSITSPEQRIAWNGFLDNLNGQPVTEDALNAHAEANPDFQIKAAMLPQIQEEHAAIRTGDAFGPLNADQLSKVRAGMGPDALKETDLAKSYYPEAKSGATDYGTDIEAFAGGGKKPLPSAAPATLPPVAEIPKPNYDDPKSRLNYAQQFTKKYGPLMQGRGDTPLRINEKPEGGSDTSKNLSIKAASKLGLDPALLYSSAMEEGMSGLYPDKNGQVDDSGDKNFPVNGFSSFGLDNFGNAFKGLVKKGYLPADFAQNFHPEKHMNEKDEKVLSANFKDVDSALQAKAAMIRDAQDQTQEYATKNGIPLSERAKQFFTLVNYNAGEGNMQKMIKEYNRSGYLKDDKFIDKRPSDSWKTVWENNARRIKMADALKAEKLF